MLNRRRPDRKRRYKGHKGEEPLKEEKERGDRRIEEGEAGRTRTMGRSRIEEGEVGKEKIKKKKTKTRTRKRKAKSN